MLIRIRMWNARGGGWIRRRGAYRLRAVAHRRAMEAAARSQHREAGLQYGAENILREAASLFANGQYVDIKDSTGKKKKSLQLKQCDKCAGRRCAGGASSPNHCCCIYMSLRILKAVWQDIQIGIIQMDSVIDYARERLFALSPSNLMSKIPDEPAAQLVAL
ncbi:hypothetical protein BRADI_5g16115v3 [Brachypodium distachyon]|uniref:Uncharacterized protein n=1 Tax=Brachypodium distachyon TaxID=15368 RepID=A0A0Q3KTV7_BRADI|nr:hypothetical protein BRADI_5g16115v3 [Brachypodium distachyon]